MSNHMESKNIKDYLHLYLGCEVLFDGEFFGKLIGINLRDQPSFNPLIIETDKAVIINRALVQVMPILRPLSDMTEEEAKDLCRMQIKGIRWTDGIKIIQMNPTVQFVIYSLGENVSNDYGRTKRFLNIESYLVPQFKYLLSKGFDLFGLIDAGLAIKKSQ